MVHRRLLRQTVLVLAATHASEAARDASLGALESILDLGPSYADVILRPHTAELLESLRSLVAAAAATNGGARPKRLRPGVKVCRHRWTYCYHRITIITTRYFCQKRQCAPAGRGRYKP